MATTRTELDHLALLRLDGPDARTFLQGQVTCDIDLVTSSKAIPGGLCTPQGRLYASFMVANQRDTIFLRLRNDIADSCAQTLNKYIVFSKAELKDAREQYKLIGLAGEDSTAVLEDVCDAVPKNQYEVVQVGDDLVMQVDEEGQRFECWVAEGSKHPALRAALEALPSVPSTIWQCADIASGVAQIEASVVDMFIPQMLNFELTGHVSFTKGCYTGQEVVARMHYRGQSKRRTYLVAIPELDSAVGLSGTALFRAEQEQSIGNIVNATTNSEGFVIALAVITKAVLETDSVHLGEPGGAKLKLGALPYSLD